MSSDAAFNASLSFFSTDSLVSTNNIYCRLLNLLMKILIVATGYPSLQDPRWGCFERDQAIALKNSGHDVSILVLDAEINRHGLKHGISITHTDAFDVYVGHWLSESTNGQTVDIEKFREALEDEFNLPNDFEFVVDIHWDLGHGWSEELLTMEE